MARKKDVSADPAAASPAASKAATARKPAARSKKSTGATQEMIAKRAYELYVARGRVDGFADQDWRQAEQELGGM